MTLGELIKLFRQQADDGTSHPLWDDTELASWVNDAEVEACRRARLLVDSRSTSICQLTLAPTVDSYALDPRIIYLRRVKLATRALPLDGLDYRDMDSCVPGWESHAGNVTGYVLGLDTGRLRIYKIPTVADTVNLLVVREPLVPMVQPADIPEINARYHRSLVHWMLYRGFSRTEAQTYDPKLASQHLSLFEGEFGTRMKATAFEEEWMRNTSPHDENLPYHHTAGEF
jgi:hypothetical protein